MAEQSSTTTTATTSATGPQGPAGRQERAVEVVFHRVAQNSPWQPFRWQLRSAAWVEALDNAAELPPAQMVGEVAVAYKKAELFTDEAEGYYLNLTTDRPAWMVHYRLSEASSEDPPELRFVTLSYNEAGRLLDAGEPVETFPIDPDTAHWLARFTDAHFVMAPRKRQRPRSFISPGERSKG